ncbi:hypothetical protein NLG97_g6618 [Lecanicillium saksenae]|uniref:Uncharacterized protein n=1 Tax=Lecanicillium saksenae TaxID=468837 RepID=A0ACC1QSB6_9HYPO|nr:hypothetical protein NLG97_g6618 [Lecanicillium saksenae]
MATVSSSPRPEWDPRQSELWAESCAHKDIYSARVGNFDVHLHPSVLSPKYFPETIWFDINPKAVEITKKNFESNGQTGLFVVKDIFENVTEKYDYIFWNHPWAWDGTLQADDKRLEMFLDEGNISLKRFISQSKNYLVEGGSVLLSTVPYANLSAIEEICAACGYTREIVREGLGDLGNEVTEKFYIIQIRPLLGVAAGKEKIR